VDLNRISIVARERSSWEALDLGIVLARRWYRQLALGWMLPSMVVFIIFSVIFRESLWVGITITWWLKPVWDRVPLFIASRALFGETVTVKQAMRAFFSLARKDFFSWLLWRRFSLTRSFDMPVTILEGLSGKVRRKRLEVLHIESGSAATWLTIVCVHLEFILVIGGASLFYLLIPDELEIGFLDIVDVESQLSEMVFNVMSYVAMVLVAPFYTLAGFALYISRRISLEGWDLEIRFRHLAERHQSSLLTSMPTQSSRTREAVS